MQATTRRHPCLFLAQSKHRLKAPKSPFVFVIRKENRMFSLNLYARSNLKVLLQSLHTCLWYRQYRRFSELAIPDSQGHGLQIDILIFQIHQIARSQ
jgi:hypothetical protein